MNALPGINSAIPTLPPKPNPETPVRIIKDTVEEEEDDELMPKLERTQDDINPLFGLDFADLWMTHWQNYQEERGELDEMTKTMMKIKEEIEEQRTRNRGYVRF